MAKQSIKSDVWLKSATLTRSCSASKRLSYECGRNDFYSNRCKSPTITARQSWANSKAEPLLRI